MLIVPPTTYGLQTGRKGSTTEAAVLSAYTAADTHLPACASSAYDVASVNDVSASDSAILSATVACHSWPGNATRTSTHVIDTYVSKWIPT